MIPNKQEPLVSIIVNCFNGEQFLRQTLDSILAQTYQNWEVIFWDNQSTDKSAEIYKSYNEERFKYFYAPKHTLAAEARSYAVDKATGEFVAFLDTDDWWIPTKLDQQIPLFADPQIGMVCSNFWIHYEQKNKTIKALKNHLPEGFVLKNLLTSYFVGLLTLVIRRSALNSLSHGFDARYHIICDMDLVVRLSLKWKLASIQDPIAYYRIHGKNETVTKRPRHIQEYEQWLHELENNDDIKSLPEIKNSHHILAYTKSKYLIFDGHKKSAIALMNNIFWGIPKMKLILALLCPTFIINKLKN